MNGLEILDTLRSLGVAVRLVKSNKLRLERASKIPAEMVPRIREAKPAILEALRNRPASCSLDCYELEADIWIQRPWAGCTTGKAESSEPRKVSVRCWHVERGIYRRAACETATATLNDVRADSIESSMRSSPDAVRFVPVKPWASKSTNISQRTSALYIVQKAKRELIQPYLKTKNGTREVDLRRQLAGMPMEYVGDRRSGLVFHSSTGAQLLQSNALSDSLHPILDYMAHERVGFNIFRRFRLTHLEKSDCPEPLKHLWSGHVPN